MKNTAVLFLCFFSAIATTNAQDFEVFTTPAIELELETESRWSFEFDIANNYVFYTEDAITFTAKYLQLTGYAIYELTEESSLNIGYRHRFKHVFSDQKLDEKRLMLEYEQQFSDEFPKLKGRLRLEGRFREKNTLRTRYEFGVTFPIVRSEEEIERWLLTAKTEALWSTGADEIPAIDHYAALEIEKALTDNTAVSLGLNYKLKDYFQNPYSELFIKANLSIELD